MKPTYKSQLWAAQDLDPWLGYGSSMEFSLKTQNAADHMVRLFARPHLESIAMPAGYVVASMPAYEEPDRIARALRWLGKRTQLPKRLAARAWRQKPATFSRMEWPTSMLETIQIMRAELYRRNVEARAIYVGARGRHTLMEEYRDYAFLDGGFRESFFLNGEIALFGLPLITLPWLEPNAVMVG